MGFTINRLSVSDRCKNNAGILVLVISVILFIYSCEDQPVEREPFTAPAPSATADSWTEPAGYHLAWSDEFDGPDIDLSNWNYETEATGWDPSRNGEWQRYTDNGTGGGNGGYTSARMVTQGKHSWQYGIIAACMQLPYGKGIWPAFWMMGVAGAWPANGEIDIMEMIGGEGNPGGDYDNITRAALHWDNSGHQSVGGTHLMPDKLAADWHYYICEWTATSITIKIDDITVFSQDITSSQFDEFRQPAYILLNLAIGGDWPGPPDSNTVFLQYMYIDWVRVYQPD